MYSSTEIYRIKNRKDIAISEEIEVLNEYFPV